METRFKNIFDWISRIEKIVWYNKPMFLMSTSDGSRGAKLVLEIAYNRIDEFDETKLKEGIARSLEKRPVSQEEFLKLIEDIKKDIRSLGEREIPSKQIGETVMKFLRKIDEVAFVRFASVYRSFQDPLEFSEEVKKLSND